MTPTIDIVKTIIAFRHGLIRKIMPTDLAAANAIACFEAHCTAISDGRMPKLNLDVNSDQFELLMNTSLMVDGATPASTVAQALTTEQQESIIDAFSWLSEEVIMAEGLPMSGGLEGVEEVWNHLNKQVTH